MSIENMFGDLDKIDILAETKTGEVVMVLVCNGFIDGSPETQKALLDKMEGYLNHTERGVSKGVWWLARDFACDPWPGAG